VDSEASCVCARPGHSIKQIHKDKKHYRTLRRIGRHQPNPAGARRGGISAPGV